MYVDERRMEIFNKRLDHENCNGERGLSHSFLYALANSIACVKLRYYIYATHCLHYELSPLYFLSCVLPLCIWSSICTDHK